MIIVGDKTIISTLAIVAEIDKNGAAYLINSESKTENNNSFSKNALDWVACPC
jgi:hypothetical protein